MKIFQVNDVDFIAAETEAEAKLFILSNWEWDNDSWIEYNYSPRELTEEDLNSYIYTESEYWKITFKEQLENLFIRKDKFPCLFATLDNEE